MKTATKTILIIDDDDLLREVLQMVVSDPEAGGHTTMAATDGHSGLVLARSCRPDLIVLDIDMPVMGGETFVQELRAELGEAAPPILLMSGRTDVFDIAKQLGVDGGLHKPFVERALWPRS